MTADPDRDARVSGEPVLPDYAVIALAGRGAFGSVWVARDVTGVLHAVKVVELTGTAGRDPGLREEQALTLVRQRVGRHPHIVAVGHVSRRDGRLVYAMELADPSPGTPPAGHAGYRADTLACRIQSGQRLPAADALRVALDLLSALDAMHAAGVVHRDVKPANVVFVGGVPKLADIGLAAADQSALSVAGTPGFLPPDGSTGPDADLYALGKLLYQAVTGLHPSDFPAVPAALMAGPDAGTVRRLNRVLLRACAPAKADRFQDAAAFRVALSRGPEPATIRWAFAAAPVAALALAAAVMTTSPRPAGPAAGPQAGVTRARPPATAAAGTDRPAAERVDAVAGELRRLNPGFDGRVRWRAEGNRVVRLAFDPHHVADLSPLAALPELEVLDCGADGVERRGSVADLAPLRHLRLKRLRAAWCRLNDLAPLAGLNLEWLDVAGNFIRDLGPIRGMPLAELFCHTNDVRDLSPVAGLRLRAINCGANPVHDWTPLAALPLTRLTVIDCSFADLGVLRSARLEYVWCQKSKVADLGPLAGMPLVYLDCAGCRVSDLRPLRATPVRFLGVRDTDVSDLSPLRGSALEELGLTGSRVTDLSPLRGTPLRRIDLDYHPARDRAALAALPNLEVVNRRRAADVLR